jgi:hypothetical protein
VIQVLAFDAFVLCPAAAGRGFRLLMEWHGVYRQLVRPHPALRAIHRALPCLPINSSSLETLCS